MSGENENANREDIHSKAVRAGKRTYFFDVKSTRGNDLYITITESKRRYQDDGKFSYEKHKLFLYKEDFDKFADGLTETIEKISELRAEEGSIYAQTIERGSNNGSDTIESISTKVQEAPPQPPSENGVASEDNKVNEDSDKNKFTSISFDDLGSGGTETDEENSE